MDDPTPLRRQTRPMMSSRATTRAKPNLVGIAADHGGFALKQYLSGMLRAADHRVKVGASIAANKVTVVRACLIHEAFSAHQGLEDDNLNLICLGGRVVGHATAWELVHIFLAASFSGAERHLRRLAKVAELERGAAEEAA